MPDTELSFSFEVSPSYLELDFPIVPQAVLPLTDCIVVEWKAPCLNLSPAEVPRVLSYYIQHCSKCVCTYPFRKRICPTLSRNEIARFKNKKLYKLLYYSPF